MVREALPGDRLFVYGSLRSDVPRSRCELLGRNATCVGRARMRGRLHHLGDYPGAVSCDDPHAWVHGEVYVLDPPRETLIRLDTSHATRSKGWGSGSCGPQPS